MLSLAVKRFHDSDLHEGSAAGISSNMGMTCKMVCIS